MTITCGTDFSDHGTQAAEIAAALARKLGVPLKLVRVLDDLGAELAAAEGSDRIHDSERARLDALAGRLRAAHAIDVEAVAVPGVAADKLVEVASLARSTLLVVGALGRERRARWLLGSVAERVAQASPVPVLVIRDAAPFAAWARGERPLRVVVGVEPTANCRAALRWATNLTRFGACELLVTQVVWPVEQHQRLGVPLPTPLDHLRPEVEEVVLRDLQRWAGEVPAPCSFVVRAGWGRVGSHLTQLADEATADLIVTGTHQRAGLARLWQGSVSRGVLHEASMSVACVPPGSVVEDVVATPRFRRILAPTDFSPLANRAIQTAYGLAGRGGQVHLLHVVERGAGGEGPSIEDRLRALVPTSAAEQDITTTFEVAAGGSVGPAIAQAAARQGVDAICMATHGRSGVGRLVLGSQAQDVLGRSRHPVVLVPPERDE